MRSITATLAIVGVTSTARAEPTAQDEALATALFNDGKSLLTDGKVSEACRKLEESRRLDPLPGTILNLAACHEKEGLMASAFSEFREARALAVRDGRNDRVAVIDERLGAIEPRISQLVIVVGPEVDRAELRIMRNATLLGQETWGTRIPVDPGEHIIEASAPRKRTWRSVVTVGREGDVQTTVVAALQDEAPPTAAIVPVLAPNAAAVEGPAADSTGLSTRRTLALASAGLGVLGLGLGSYFGVQAIQKHNDPAATCRTLPCSSTSVALSDEAKFAADAATVSFAVAVVALGGAALLWFGDKPSRSTARVRLSPAFRPGDARLELSSTF